MILWWPEPWPTTKSGTLLLVVQKSGDKTTWDVKKPCKSWDKLPTSTGTGFLPSTVPTSISEGFSQDTNNYTSGPCPQSGLTNSSEFFDVKLVTQNVPGSNRKQKKLSTSGHNTFSVRDTERTSHSKRSWKMTTAELCLWTSAFALRSAVGLKKGSGLPRRTHSCCVILQWQNIKFCIRIPIYHSKNSSTSCSFFQPIYHGNSLNQVSISIAAFNSSCTNVIFPEAPSEASKWPSSSQGSLRWYFNFTSIGQPIRGRYCENFGRFGKWLWKICQKTKGSLSFFNTTIKNRRPKQQNLPSSLLLVTSIFPQA